MAMAANATQVIISAPTDGCGVFGENDPLTLLNARTSPFSVILPHVSALMPEITLRFGEPLRKTLGVRRMRLTLPGQATVRDMLDALAAQFPDFEAAFRGDDLGRAYPYVVFVNGRPVTPPHFDTAPLHDGDVVYLVLPVVGGCCG
jgi:sulfur carrier protein ThiS